MLNFLSGHQGYSRKSKKAAVPAAVLFTGGLLGGLIAYAFIPGEVSVEAKVAPSQEIVIEADTPKNTETSETATEPTPAGPTIKTVSVEKGDTLMKVLTRAGANRQESHEAITVLSSVFDPRRLKIGQDVTLSFTEEASGDDANAEPEFKLLSISLNEDVDREVAVVRNPDEGFKAQETVISLEKKMARAGGTIDNSLFLSASQAGLPTSVIIDLIRIFSYDVDFQREIQPGDSFEVFFERFVDEDGRPLKEGEIQWASMTLSGTQISLYRYKTSDDGVTDYYTEKGHSVRKTLMRTPIDGARLTSSFGKRKHPILGYTKMHKGADFGAPRGTPIMAAGNGVVEVAGRNGGYGNYVRIRHTTEYKTAYAHMKGFAKKIRKGARVKQGQIIGYVGSTGRSTGPHLHYEVHKNGRQINPMSVKLPAGRKLKGKMLTAFENYTKDVDQEVASIPLSTQVARLGSN
ncbi:peptidoglycan DD-metalloendopeptidase family protein [Sneathiella limimaris]|uniref:peptidoglycan DD-metalloendopeptidase family protein n=1 Tax=Sneathiella limimaris TaxID=1964213 RepID=UPI001469D264